MLSRYASRELDRVLAGHGITLTEFQLMLMLWAEGPARTLALARRLRLDPGPIGRSLARLEERGVVRRPERWRFSKWVLEPIWHDVNKGLCSELGPAVVSAVARAVDRLPPWVPREGRGWLDD